MMNLLMRYFVMTPKGQRMNDKQIVIDSPGGSGNEPAFPFFFEIR